DRAHLAQIHAHWVVGPFGRRGLFLLGDVLGAFVLIVVAVGGDLVWAFAGLLFLFGRILIALDDVDAHLVDRGLDVLDLVGRHLARRKRFVEFVVSEVSAALRLGDQLLDRRLVEVDQRRIVAAAVLAVALGDRVIRRHRFVQSVSCSRRA